VGVSRKKKNFLEGFKEVVDAIIKYKSDFQNWVKNQLVPHPAFTRVIVLATEPMKNIRSSMLRAKILDMPFDCDDDMGKTAWSIPYKDVAILAMYEEDCKKLYNAILGERYSVPAYYININEKMLYYPDLKTEARADIGYTKSKKPIPSTDFRTFANVFDIDKKKKGTGSSSAIFSVTGSAAVTNRINKMDKATGDALIKELDKIITDLGFLTVAKRKRRMRKM